jgi:hypothetical protein
VRESQLEQVGHVRKHDQPMVIEFMEHSKYNAMRRRSLLCKHQ